MRVFVQKKNGEYENVQLENLKNFKFEYELISEITIDGWRFYPHHNPPNVNEEISFLRKILTKLLEK